jgi:hypothetical protein
MNRRPFNTSQPSASMKTTMEIWGALGAVMLHLTLVAAGDG